MQKKPEILNNLVITHEGYRGNLLFFLINAYTKSHKKVEHDDIKEALLALIEQSKTHPMVCKILDFKNNSQQNAFSQLLEYITSKIEVHNKTDTLIDIQHITLGISLNPSLSPKEKKIPDKYPK